MSVGVRGAIALLILWTGCQAPHGMNGAGDDRPKFDNPGWPPFENKRVHWVYREASTSFYAALLSDRDDVKIQTGEPPPAVPTSQPADPPPDLIIYRGWIYVNGDRARVATPAVIAQAEGTAILIYYHPNDSQTQRVCCLSGGLGAGVRVSESNGSNHFVPVGSYVELRTHPNGSFANWVATAGQYVRPLTDLSGDAPHNNVMTAVMLAQFINEVS